MTDRKLYWLRRITNLLVALSLGNAAAYAQQTRENLRFPAPDGVFQTAFSYGLMSGASEYCAVLDNGNAKCRLVVQANPVSLSCIFLIWYRLDRPDPVISAFTMTAEASYDQELFAPAKGAARTGEGAIAGTGLAQTLMDAGSNAILDGKVAEHADTVVIKNHDSLDRHAILRLDDHRMLELSLTQRLRPRTMALAVRQIMRTPDGGTLVSDKVSCSQKMRVSAWEYDALVNEYLGLGAPATFTTRPLEDR